MDSASRPQRKFHQMRSDFVVPVVPVVSVNGATEYNWTHIDIIRKP